MSDIITSRKWQNDNGQTLEIFVLDGAVVFELGKESIKLPLENAYEVIGEIQALLDKLEEEADSSNG